MGELKQPDPVMRVLAAFSRHDAALDWARDWGVRNWGPIALESPRFAFTETQYYHDSMGADLKKTFFGFKRLVSPDSLPCDKLASNAAELEYSSSHEMGESRPLNLDPGHLTHSKFLLATTKDHAHRIYLGQSIYAEITLRYLKGKWQPWDWTYPDYCRDDFRQFFTAAREKYRQLLASHLAP